MLGPFALAPKATMSARALPLAEALAARGHRVTVILPPWDNPAQSGRTWQDAGVAIRNISLPRRFETAGIVYRLLRAVHESRPDLVHLFKPKGHGALAALALGRRYPLVVDTDDWEGRGGWNDLNPYSPAQRALFAWQERDLPRRAAATTVASRALEARVRGFGVPPGRVCYLPNGVSRRRHGDWAAAAERAPDVRRRLGLGDAPTVLLYTRFVEFAPARAVALFQSVLQEVPGARVLVIGKGFFGEEEVLLRQAGAAGIADRVTHLPWVEREVLPAHLAAGDVAVLPYDDTPVNRAKCSVKTLDLLTAARPVVAEAVGQNRDYLEDGVSALLVPPGATERFARAVADLLRDRERRCRIALAARERVWREFDWARLVERAEASYAAAIRSRAR